MANENASQEGYDAYWDQGVSDENPYPPGTEDLNSWAAGWLKAEEEDYREDISG